MVYYILEYSAELENVESLHPALGFDHPSNSFLFKLECENCGNVSSKETCVSLDAQVAFTQRAYLPVVENIFLEKVPKSRGHRAIYQAPTQRKAGFANAVQKCSCCGRLGTISMLPGFGRPFAAADGDGEKFVPLMVFDCCGLKPVNYSLSGTQWTVHSTSGMIFEDVDMCTDWAEYDEKICTVVSVVNLQSKFEVVKGWKYCV